MYILILSDCILVFSNKTCVPTMFLYELLFHVRPIDCLQSLQGHAIAVGLCSEPLMRLSSYIHQAYKKSLQLSRESNPESLELELSALTPQPRFTSA